MHKSSYYIINAITIYRIAAAFLLFSLVINNKQAAFRWLLAFSFFTDLIDGFFARKFKVTSLIGSKIDSIADDLTILMAVIGAYVFKPGFIHHEIVWIISLLALYLLQVIIALIRYGRISSFHTWLAKCAALFQGTFFILLFFLPQWPLPVFYAAAVLTIIDLVEEIILVMILPSWQTDVKGWYWIKERLNIHKRMKKM